jgi:hypothetical protein
MSTFAELGAHFPLFEAPVEDASDFRGACVCSLCQQQADICFELGIGCAVMCECPRCGTLNGLDASDAEPSACRSCQAEVPWPDLPDEVVDQWLFCGKAPMVFKGAWPRERFTREAPDGNGRSFFESIVEDVVPGLWEDRLHDTTGVYVFRCSVCRRWRAHWDMA